MGSNTKILAAFLAGTAFGSLAIALVYKDQPTTSRVEASDSAHPLASPSAAKAETRHTAADAAACRGVATTQGGGGSGTLTQPTMVHLQQSITASLNADSLSKYQPQLERWTCRADDCDAALRLPATVDASRTHDMRAVSDIFASLQEDLKDAGVTVGINRVVHDPEGMAISLRFSPTDRERVRSYTDAQIAEIRQDTLLQYLDHASSAPHP